MSERTDRKIKDFNVGIEVEQNLLVGMKERLVRARKLKLLEVPPKPMTKKAVETNLKHAISSVKRQQNTVKKAKLTLVVYMKSDEYKRQK